MLSRWATCCFTAPATTRPTPRQHRQAMRARTQPETFWMKHFLTLLIAGVLAHPFLPASATDRELFVFDLELNKPFEVRECQYEVIAVPIGQQGLLRKRTTSMYRYIESRPANDKCFQREGVGYTVEPMDMAGNPNPLPPAGPLVNGDVKVIHADSLRPSLVGDKWIWVRVAGGTLQAVKFYFPALGIDDVQQALQAKYGAPTRIEKRYLDRRSDGRLDFYIATWVRPRLTVVLTSLDTDIDMGGSRSTVGHVRVDYGTPVRRTEKNRL